MISVIIPIYNVEKYLSRCLDSVINQTFSNLEILLINDGSTDSSGFICDEYAKNDSRIVVIHQENKGPSHARNKGLDKAKGEYISFIDPDDFISLNFFEILLNQLNETDSDICICNFQSFSNTIQIKSSDLINTYKKVYNGSTFITEFKYTKDTVRYVVLWNKLYKKCLFENLRMPEDVKICEDEYIWYKCMYNAKKICEIDTTLYYYYKRENSTTNRLYKEFSFKKEIAFLEALEHRINFCEKEGLNYFMKDTILYRNKILRKIYISTPKNNVPKYIKIELEKNIRKISYLKRIKIYLKKIFS